MTSIAYAFLGSFLVAALFLQWWQQTAYPWWLWCAIGLAVTACRRQYRCLAALAGMALALCCVMRTTHLSNPNTADYYANESRQTIAGVIVAEPDRRPLHTKYTVKTDTVTSGTGTVQNGVHGNVLVSDYRNWPRYAYGDRVTATGTLEQPRAIEDFRYDHYLARYDIYAVMYRGSITHRQTGKPSLRRLLYQVKEITEARINTLLPEPHASFMAGLLTGSRKGIPDSVMSDFNATGLTHIIAISGYNITIIITIISAALFWLDPNKRLLPAVAAIVIFTVFVGASAAVVRAAIMGILGLLALHLNRLASARLCVLWTACFMVVWNPKILWYDAGFQLSFLAVIGLLELGPLWQYAFRRIPQTLGLRESVQMTMAAQVTAVPLIIVLFGRMSLIAPLANMLAAPAIPLGMLLGFLAVITSLISETLGRLLAYLSWSCLEWILIIANLCADIPLASISLHLPAWILLPYYLLLALTIHKASRLWCPKATALASS